MCLRTAQRDLMQHFTLARVTHCSVPSSLLGKARYEVLGRKAASDEKHERPDPSPSVLTQYPNSLVQAGVPASPLISPRAVNNELISGTC